MTYTVLEVVAAGIVRAEGIYLNAPETAATPSEIGDPYSDCIIFNSEEDKTFFILSWS